MRRGPRSVPVAIAAALLVAFSACSMDRPPAEASEPPNIVLILLDDADKALVEQMPNITELLKGGGMSFERAYVPQSLCCPTRASILTGMYVHNHRVLGNKAEDQGGYGAFRDRGHERRVIAGTLQEAGYRTALIGKYFNQ